MVRLAIAAVLCIVLPMSASAQFHTNRAEIKHQVFHSKVLNEDRSIVVYTPEVFPQFKDAVMPVLYVLDGDLFADIFAAYVNLYSQKFSDLPPIKVVGIGNVELRARDYTPKLAMEAGSGSVAGTDPFMEFVLTELMPSIESEYKTPPYRVIAGHSLGGLMALHMFSHYPKIFRAVIASSPYLGGNNNAYMPELTDHLIKASGQNRSVFLSIANEGSSYVPNGRYIDSLLTARKVPGLRHQFIRYPNESHGSVLGKSTYDGFKFAFRLGAKAMISNEPVAKNIAVIEGYNKELSEIFAFPRPTSEDDINDLGYRYLYDWNAVDRAIECFTINIKLHPQSGTAYDSYAEGLMIKGDKANAILNYEKSLSLDPKNDNAKAMLVKLRAGK